MNSINQESSKNSTDYQVLSVRTTELPPIGLPVNSNQNPLTSRQSPFKYNQKYTSPNNQHYSPSKRSPLSHSFKNPSYVYQQLSPSKYTLVLHNQDYSSANIQNYSLTRNSPLQQNQTQFPISRHQSLLNQSPRHQHKPLTNHLFKKLLRDNSPPRNQLKLPNIISQHQNNNPDQHANGEVCPTCRQSLTLRNAPSDAFQAALDKHFPDAYKMDEFVFQTKEVLVPSGFYPHVNTLACIGLCRDEITTPFMEAIEAMWGEGFICGSLGGMLFCGATGFAAAHHHAPDEGNFVYYCFTHIGIDHEGTLGSVYRTRSGMHEKTTACGALAAFATELASNKLSLDFDEDDIEMSMLKKQILKKSSLSTDPLRPPTLFTVTMAAYETITMDLEKHARNDAKKYKGRKYALFTGVQIHGPQGTNYCWLGKSSLLINGTLSSITFPKHPAQQGDFNKPSKQH